MVEFQASASSGLGRQRGVCRQKSLPQISLGKAASTVHVYNDAGSKHHSSETYSSFSPVLTSLVPTQHAV